MKKRNSQVRIPGVILVLYIVFLAGSLTALPRAEQEGTIIQTGDTMADLPDNYETATLGGGCFWCVEAVYEPIEGVHSVVSGYSGGTVANPVYEAVTSGSTGHAEVVQVNFDPEIIRYEQILGLFFKAHDPTTLNKQGYDVGTQYRSIILTHSDEQNKIARDAVAVAQNDWNNSIVTQIAPLEVFYPAEEYHQDFYERNPDYGYCAAVIRPKMLKLGLEGVESIDVLKLDL